MPHAATHADCLTETALRLRASPSMFLVRVCLSDPDAVNPPWGHKPVHRAHGCSVDCATCAESGCVCRADRGPIARHSHRSGTLMSDNCDSAEFSSGALFGPWHGRHGSLRRSAAGAAATCSSNSHSFSTTASTMVGAAAAAAAAAAAPSAAALRDDDTTTSSPGLSPKRGYSGLPAPLRSVVPVVALFGGWPRVAMSHLELSERLARVAADAAAAIAFLSTGIPPLPPPPLP